MLYISHTLLVWLNFNLSFWQSGTLWPDDSNSKFVQLIKHYNFGVHQINILWWHQLDKVHLKLFTIYCLYILSLTLLSLSIMKNGYILKINFKQRSCSARLDFSFDTILKVVRKCLQLHLQQFRWRLYQKLTSDSDSRPQITSGTTRKGHKFDYELLSMRYGYI